ncbi:MAG: hypothetical protein ABJP80_09170 [Algibacter sp.]
MKKLVIILSLTLSHLGFGQVAELNRNSESAISFLPNNGNSIFHISHGLNNDLNISHGTNPGDGNIMTIKNYGHIGIGTTSPAAKLDVEGGDFYLGKEVSSNGQRREFRVYGYDNSNKFYGSIHSNYDDSKRSFDISTNDQTSQIKIDASANSSANIILKPGVSGYVGIGTSSPDAKLAVKGDIHTQEVKVDLLGAVMPDYVFYKDYKLKTLTEVEQYINEKGHLPNIPSAIDVETNGLLLKEMNLKLLEKIEELTLYTIEQQKEITTLKKQNTRIEELEKENKESQSFSKRLAEIEKLLNKRI